jgi:hypothetical protein
VEERASPNAYRTHTLHDPVDYKLRDIGVWALLDQVPTPTFYS